jgi:hypothetical protein
MMLEALNLDGLNRNIQKISKPEANWSSAAAAGAVYGINVLLGIHLP